MVVTSYEMASRELSSLGRLDWGVLVVDEGHRLKNKTGRLFQDLQRLNAKHRLLLTGARANSWGRAWGAGVRPGLQDQQRPSAEHRPPLTGRTS